MASLPGRIVMMVLLVSAATAAGGAEEMPLAEQIAGLGPVPRLAYLRHLLEQGRRDAEVLFQTAVAFHELEQRDSALYYYGEAIGEDPGGSKPYVNRGVLYDEMGREAAAIHSFVAALSVNSRDVLAHAHLAFLFHNNNDYRSAWRHLSQALEIEPDHPQCLFYRAIFFSDARMYSEAIREWEAVIAAQPDGFLAEKARENIVLLQKALNNPAAARGWEPRR